MAPKLPPTLFLLAGLSGGITIVISTIYLSICTLTLVYNNCAEVNSTHFLSILYSVYVLDDECEWSISLDYVTKPETVFILTIITLCTSAILLITAICFIVVVKNKTEAVLIVGYIYVALSLGSLIVDITFATHFGIDSAAISNENNGLEIIESSILNLLQIGAISLMIIALKGFAVLIINIVLLIMIVVYLEKYRGVVNKSQHSIHDTGVLHAYDFSPQASTPNMLPAQAASRRSIRNSHHEEIDYIRPYNMPWQMHNETEPAPFSYLKESPLAASSPTLPGWRREWSGPTVPMPDYSPQPRRLKSAMKPNPY